MRQRESTYPQVAGQLPAAHPGNLSGRTRRAPELPQGCPKVAPGWEFWPNVGQFWVNPWPIDQIWPKCPNSTKLAELGRLRPRLAEFEPAFGLERCWSKLCKCWPKLVKLAKSWTNSARPRRMWAIPPIPEQPWVNCWRTSELAGFARRATVWQRSGKLIPPETGVSRATDITSSAQTRRRAQAHKCREPHGGRASDVPCGQCDDPANEISGATEGTPPSPQQKCRATS